MNELYELTRKRRSARRYGTAHIDDEVIQEIRSLLGVPDSYTVLNLIAIGEKAEDVYTG